MVSSSRDFSDLYSWQEAHHTWFSKVGIPQSSRHARPPHPGPQEINTHLDEGDSDHDQHGLRSKRRGVNTGGTAHESMGVRGGHRLSKYISFLFAK